MTCSRHHSQYVYSASAYALAAEFERPKKHSLSPQASVVLSGHGGHGSQRVPGFNVDGLISFKEAYSEVGGSYDDCHQMHTTHAWSVVEGLNVADMLTADRVVSRVAVYHDASGKKAEPTYDFTGSYFENLRIAGHPIDMKLDTNSLHAHDTFAKLAKAHKERKCDHLLLGHGLCDITAAKLQQLEDTYHALSGMSELVAEWKKKERPAERGAYMLSAANHLDLEKQVGKTELENFGAIICVPKFGVVRLGEIIVNKHSRTLRMFRVQMCSSGHGGSDGGTSGSGGSMPPG
ncbi:MAG TPA: choice-of-anchor P family protein [Candidatus Angelobacter sp.]|nr:choice-of-anchor P family protein [Candidatus Angelobacter sp.]